MRTLQRKCGCRGAGTCYCGKPSELRRGAARAHGPAAVPPIVSRVTGSSGRSLDPAVRRRLEPRFGFDFSAVRVHTDSQAAESARAVHADAYTVGRDIVFAAGRYAPESARGSHLLAHELSHVVQQNGRESASPVSISTPDDPAELEAERAAGAAGGVSVRTGSASPLVVHRQEESKKGEEGNSESGDLCARFWVYGVGGRVTWSGISQETLDENVRILDEDSRQLKRATADSTDVLDAVYFGESRGRAILKVPDHCTITYDSTLDSFGSCCNRMGSFLAKKKGKATAPRSGTASEFGVPNDWKAGP